MKSIFKRGGIAVPMLVAVMLVGCATQKPAEHAAKAAATASDFSEWPCLSRALPCGDIPTRKPIKAAFVAPLDGDPARGKALANERSKGNCVACHLMQGAEQPGSKGPDLSTYGNWQRTDAETYALVYDMRWRNPDTVMPPIGTNQILTDQELRDVVAFLQASK